jgi:hypothetical protein
VHEDERPALAGNEIPGSAEPFGIHPHQGIFLA